MPLHARSNHCYNGEALNLVPFTLREGAIRRQQSITSFYCFKSKWSNCRHILSKCLVIRTKIYTRISFNLCVCLSFSIFQFAVVWLTNQKVSCKFDLCYNNSFELAYQENRSRERQLEENLTLVQVQPNEFLFLQLQVSIFPNISWLQNSSQENGRQESIQFSISCCLLHIRINFLKVHGW